MEEKVVEIYHKHKGTYGRKRIAQAIRNSGASINHKKVYRIMRDNGLKAVIRKKYCRRKYTKEHVVPNLLNREFTASEPLEKLVCDITELKRIGDKRYYLFSILDLYSNMIVAANVSFRYDWSLVAGALKGLNINKPKILLHSDQGCHFTSNLFKVFAEQNKITLSMSRVGNCYDNAAKESFFGHFKEEFYIYYNPQTQDELYENIQDFIRYYNYERIQMRFKMSPIQYLQAQNFSLG